MFSPTAILDDVHFEIKRLEKFAEDARKALLNAPSTIDALTEKQYYLKLMSAALSEIAEKLEKLKTLIKLGVVKID